MYRTENQFNTTASELAIEEVYTNLDIEPNDLYIPNEGFTFRYPQDGLMILHNIRLLDSED